MRVFFVTKYSAPRDLNNLLSSVIWATDNPFSPAFEKEVKTEIFDSGNFFLSLTNSSLFLNFDFIFYPVKIKKSAYRRSTHSKPNGLSFPSARLTVPFIALAKKGCLHAFYGG